MKSDHAIVVGGKRIGKSLWQAETIEAFHLREKLRMLRTEATVAALLAVVTFFIGTMLEAGWAMVIAWVLFEVALFWWVWVVVDMRPVVRRPRELEVLHS